MRIVWIAAIGLAASVAGCENSVGFQAESRAGPAGAADAWRPTWGDAATAKVRPGGPIGPADLLNKGDCTAAFLFVDPVTKIYYLGTAAHCTDAADGGDNGLGVRIQVSGVGEIGTVVFDGENLPATAGDPLDFSLIELDAGINLIANPQVVELQGPTGFLECNQVKAGDLMAWHGYGLVFGSQEQTQTRQGVVAQCVDSESGSEIFHSAAPAIFGDSGSAVLHAASGMALGVLVAQGETAVGPMLPFIFRELAKAGFGNVALATVDGGYVR